MSMRVARTDKKKEEYVKQRLGSMAPQGPISGWRQTYDLAKFSKAYSGVNMNADLKKALDDARERKLKLQEEKELEAL